MAIKVSDYADSPAVPTTYPNGKIVDETTPGANDGTQLRQVHVQDMWNVFSKAMEDSGIAFDDSEDSQTSSQFFEALAGSMQAVGTVEQSFLTEAQFMAQPGRGNNQWVLCDGQNVAGSVYEDVTGLATVPNAAGRFLRSSGGSAVTLRGTQPGQSGSHTHNMKHVHQWQFSDYIAASNIDYHALLSPDTASVSIPNGGVNTRWTGGEPADDSGGASAAYLRAYNMGQDEGYYTTGVLAPPTGSAGTNASTGTTQAQSTETRPDNITVNTFIKIN